MGQDVESQVFTRADRARFRDKLQRCREAYDRMLAERSFAAGRPSVGFEVELDLIDSMGDPALRNSEVLATLADPRFQTELARYNLELNLDPREPSASGLRDVENDLRARFDRAEQVSRSLGVRLVMTGVLPTLTERHMTLDSLSPDPRYKLLDEQIFLARGEDLRIDITGTDRLVMAAESVAPEAACTSSQLHLQVAPREFGAYWNAAQAIAGVQVAVCANSPFLFGRELWSETRIRLFEQAIDTRNRELVLQGVRPRVWFGERWIDSAGDLFEENVRYFTPLLPVSDPEDPIATLDRGMFPRLAELQLHNGTIYRWNRPVYDVSSGTPHLRIENRVLPSGPSFVDLLANAALWFGLVRGLAEQEVPISAQMSFDAAAQNFHDGARLGMAARLYWPGCGLIPAPELVVRKLLPLAYDGLDAWKVDPADRDRLLGVVERRCTTGVNGATWQSRAFHHRYDHTGRSRLDALRAMTRRYADLMGSGIPVHAWPVG